MQILTAASALVGALCIAGASADDAVAGVISVPFARSFTRRQGLQRKRDAYPVPVQNSYVAFSSYYVNVSIGTPEQTLSLQIDTGSADTWMFGLGACNRSTSPCLGGSYDDEASTTYELISPGTFQIEYYTANSGVSGDYFTDNIAFAGVSLTNQTMGLAFDADYLPTGIMGLGFFEGESSRSNLGYTYPNLLDSLVLQNKIARHVYSLYLNSLDSSTGTLLFGGYDTTKYSGTLTPLNIQDSRNSPVVGWTHVTMTFPDGAYGETLLPGTTATLDSGTSFLTVPDSIFEVILQRTGAFTIPTLDGYYVDCALGTSSSGYTGSLNFTFSDSSSSSSQAVSITVPLSELAVPFINVLTGQQVTDSTGTPYCRLGVQTRSDIDATSETPYFLGDTFLRSAYVVYDFRMSRIYVAQARHDVADSNIVAFDATDGPTGTGTGTGTSSSSEPSSTRSEIAAPTSSRLASTQTLTLDSASLTYTAGAAPGGGETGTAQAVGTVVLTRTSATVTVVLTAGTTTQVETLYTTADAGGGPTASAPTSTTTNAAVRLAGGGAVAGILAWIVGML